METEMYKNRNTYILYCFSEYKPMITFANDIDYK